MLKEQRVVWIIKEEGKDSEVGRILDRKIRLRERKAKGRRSREALG